MKNATIILTRSVFLAVSCILLSGLNSDVISQRGSLKLDGQSFTDAADDPALDMGSSSLAIEAWIKHDGNSNEDAVIITKRTGNTVDYQLSLIGLGEEVAARFMIFSPSYHATSAIGIPAGRWTHVAGTYDGTTLSIYINGSLEGSRATSGNTRANSGNLIIGSGHMMNNQFFSGEIDEIRLWSQARSENEIKNAMHSKLSGTEPALSAYYTFSGNSNDLAGDNHLTLHSNAKITDKGIFPVPPDVFGLPGNGNALLRWNDREGTGATSTYSIFRSTDANFTDIQEVTSVGPGIFEYSDDGLTNGTTYFYHVTSVNQESDESDYSFPVTVTPYATGGGGSLSLDGSSYARASDRPSLNLGQAPFTIEAWIKHDGQSDDNAIIISKRDGNLIDYELALDGSGEETALKFYIFSTSYSAVSSHGIPFGEWTHILGMYDGTTMSVYINGVLSGMRSMTGDSRINDGQLVIGANSTGSSQFFSGQIDEIRIWERTFTQSDIKSQMMSRLTGNEVGLRAYFRFDDVDAQTIRQSSLPGSLEVVGNTELVPYGVFPVPPKIYGKLQNRQSAIQWAERFDEEAEAFVLYRSTSATSDDRQEVKTFTPDQTSYTDADVTIPNSYFYEATSVVGGQESDFSYMAAITMAEQPEGNALSLGGLGYSRVTDRPTLDMGSQSLTVEAWINYDASSDDNAIILNKSSGSRVDYRLELTGSGNQRTPRFYIFSSSYSATASDPVPPGEWLHLAGVYDNGNITIYVNGEVAGTRITSGNTRANDGDLIIGANAAGNENFYVGLIDEIRIWNTGKSMFEIRDRYRDILMGNEENLVAYFRFDEMSGNVAYASDRYPKTATLLGDATFATSGIPVPVEEESIDIPSEYILAGNYPNPFNPVTTIRYGLPEATDVTITVYDALGRRVAVLVNGVTQPAGWHMVNFDAQNQPSGLYLYRMQTRNTLLTSKMMLLK